MEGLKFYEWLQAIPAYKEAIENINEQLINEVEDTINAKFKFRPYQKQALMGFDWVVKRTLQNDSVLSQLKDEDKCGDVPILGMEMATGSGKTLLIGAFITYLHLKHGINNFLILTPPRGKSAIYDKTIRNFDLNDKDCVLSNSFDKKFNLVTGDNYTDKSSNYDKDADFNVFVFNINKFFESSSGVKKVDKPWEESFWKNDAGTIVSFREYLSNLQDLVIITDEAHHFQKYSAEGEEAEKRGNSAGDIVKSLTPKFLIEFTATMVEGQKPIYRYSVNDYISEGFGKKVRAWGINTNQEQGIWEYDANVQDKAREVTDSDASKIVRAIAVHMVKKLALGYNKNPKDKSLKPILLVKARTTDHADKVLEYIQKEIPQKTDEIEKIYKQILVDNEYEINKLIQTHITKESLVKELENIGDVSFSFHTKNETQETLDFFNGLEENNMEVVVQVDKATEGWNIDNVYSILILSNNQGEIKTNVKQLIGRGLRLLREKRIYDVSDNKLLQEQELLHVICEQGNNFAKFVEDIRNEIGLNAENFRYNTKVVQKVNKTTAEDIMQFNNLKLPILERVSEPIVDEPEDLIKKLDFNTLGLSDFARNVSSVWTDKRPNGMMLKWTEKDKSQEIDVMKGMRVREGTSDYAEEEDLVISELQRTKIIKEIIKNQNLLPSDEKVDAALRHAIRQLTDKYSFFFKRKQGDNDFWERKFSNELIDHISKKIDMYFQAKTVLTGNQPFKEVFKEYNVDIEYEDDTPLNIKTKSQIHNYFETNKKEIPNFLVGDYEKAYFTYNQFGSSQEAKLAEMLDSCKEVEVWVKNRNSGQFVIRYGLGKGFNPDFILKLKDDNKVFILEVKSEGLKEASKEKIEVMKEANQLSNNKFSCHFFWHTTIDNIYKQGAKNFKSILQNDDLN